MDSNEFYEEALSQIESTTEVLLAYGLGKELTAPQATKLWMATSKLMKVLGEAKNAAMEKDPRYTDAEDE